MPGSQLKQDCKTYERIWVKKYFDIIRDNFSQVTHPLQSWKYMEEVFRIKTVTADQWIFWTNVHLCVILDIFVWHGSCVLIGALMSLCHYGCFTRRSINNRLSVGSTIIVYLHL